MNLTTTNTLILNNQESTVFSVLKSSLESCKRFYFNVAFINYGGLQLFLKLLSDLNEKGIQGKVITSTYLNFSDPKALKRLNAFDNVDLKVYDDVKNKGFHSKAYIFEYEDSYKVIIGSSNITSSALKSNIEWNVEIISKKEDPFIVEVMDEFMEIWDEIDEVTEDFLDEYEAFIYALKEHNRKLNVPAFEYSYEIKPNSMQKRAVSNLQKLRSYGEKKALVVAATGTGKTYMSAFDVKAYRPKKLLFVVHREEILRKAEESFRRVIGTKIDTGFYLGKEKCDQAKYIFASIQTLNNHYEMFKKDEFDYIIIDEAHHAAGDSYQKILNYFTPDFLLGMTATPERCDNADIYDMFDNNVAIEVRLHEAMEEELVVPFHYFGISDLDEINLEGIKLDDTQAIAKALKVNQRVDYIIKQMDLYGYDGNIRKCLGFCVSIDHAKFMSEEFNKRGITSVCLTGEDKPEIRQHYMNRLEDDNDPLEVIFTVDIFNEGVDIPSVNLVLMLRPTNSPIVFIQQLGRGLRKFKEKEYLTVLDFIGNHNRAFLIAVALKGSRYYDKDSLKVSVSNDFMNIPGDTFVQLDRISKERILKQLEKTNFNSNPYLKEQYLAFKSYCKGKIPKFLMDYIKCDGAPDPLKFLNYKKSGKKVKGYIEFLNYMEDINILKSICMDENFISIIKYLSDMLPLKRPFEYQLLLDLLNKKSMTFYECKHSILKSIEYVDDDTVLHAMETLNFDYYDSSQIKRWYKMCSLTNQKLILDDTINKILLEPYKRDYLLDTLRYGLARYKNEFNETNYGTPFFKLYAQYSMQDVAPLINCKNKFSSFRGQGLVTYGNDYFLFVNLHKDEDIKESINYKDKFISRKIFQWQTPNDTVQVSERGKNIINNKIRNIKLYLFVRKFEKQDDESIPFIYFGKVNTVKFEGNKPITCIFKLENEVPAKIYEELTNKVKIKETDA